VQAPTPSEDGPYGVTLLTYARVAARIAEGDCPSGKVLEAHGLDALKWNEATLFWGGRLADDDAVAEEFAAEYATTQDSLKRLPTMTVEEWAAVEAAILISGAPLPSLTDRGLSVPDYLRLTRHWTRVLAKDAEQHERFSQTREELLSHDAESRPSPV